MEPFSLLTAAIAFVGAEVAKKCGGLVVDRVFASVKALLKGKLGREIQAVDLTPETLQAAQVDRSSEFVQEARSIVARSSALRRAQLVQVVLEGARVLWVDDQPRNNAYEAQTFAALGIRVEFVTSTEAALVKVNGTPYDLIISDMARERPDAGLIMVRKLRESGCRTEVILYIGQVDKGRGTPTGVFGITNHPEVLLHYVLDVLERERL